MPSTSARFKLAGAALFTLVALLPMQAQAKVPHATSLLLRYHWVVGSTYRQAETDTTHETDRPVPSHGPPTVTVAIQRVTTTQTVIKVFHDASAWVRLSFTGVSTSINGKITTYSLKGYAIDQRITPRGAILSEQVHGALPQIQGTAPITDTLSSGVTNPIVIPFPAAPASVGSTWRQTLPVHTLPGYPTKTLTLTYRLLAIGTANGTPTATLGISINQKLHATGVLGTFSGVYGTKGAQTIVVQSGALTAPSHITFTFHVLIKGPIEQGTFDTALDEAVSPLQ